MIIYDYKDEFYRQIKIDIKTMLTDNPQIQSCYDKHDFFNPTSCRQKTF